MDVAPINNSDNDGARFTGNLSQSSRAPSSSRGGKRPDAILLQSTLTSPHCGYQATETMPTDACVACYDCIGCGGTLKPLPGSCCVFCSYGSAPCPPIQEGVEPCCTPKADPRSMSG